jgi:hypothetical protein
MAREKMSPVLVGPSHRVEEDERLVGALPHFFRPLPQPFYARRVLGVGPCVLFDLRKTFCLLQRRAVDVEEIPVPRLSQDDPPLA